MSCQLFKVFAGNMICGRLLVAHKAGVMYHKFIDNFGRVYHDLDCKRKLLNYTQLDLKRYGTDTHWH